MVRIGKWLQPLGRIVCAANWRDLSAEDQKQQLDDAHGELYKELRRMDHVQADLLESLEEMCAEFRALDLPYGSAAYCKANSLINKVRARGEA